jgi:hypothetical protein
VIAVAPAVVKDQRRFSIVCDNDIQKAVLIRIGKGDSSAYMRDLKAGAAHPADLGNTPVTASRFIVVN